MTEGNNLKRFRYFTFQTVIRTLILFRDVCNGVEINDPNVCWKNVDGRKVPHCCFNYYLIDDKCHKCKAGTTSTNGTECAPCSPNLYGDKCKYVCHCESHQSCDSEFGCVDLPSTSSKVELSSLSQPTNGTLFPQIKTDISGTNDAGTPIIYVMLVAAGLITWLIFCWTCSKFVNKRIQSGGSLTSQLVLPSVVLPPMPIDQVGQVSGNCITMRNTEEPNTNQNRNMDIRLPVKSQHIYECVDDLVIGACQPQDHINHDDGQVACFQSTDDSDCDSCHASVIKRETYLNPYHTLKDQRHTQTHEYIDIPTTTED